MGKATKEHRKKVQARNRKIEQERKFFKKSLQNEFLKQLELQKLMEKNAEQPEEMEQVVTEIKRVNPELEADAE